jgi:hypothetical protein
MITEAILFILIACILGKFIADYIMHRSQSESSEVTLKFDEFIKMYSCNQDNYDLSEHVIEYDSDFEDNDDEEYDDWPDDDWDDDEYSVICITFSPIDYIRYRIWYNKIKKQKRMIESDLKAKAAKDRKERFLNQVKKDMDAEVEG